MIFVNQSIGKLGIDIIKYFLSKNRKIVVITGRNSLSELDDLNVKVFRLMSYDKKNLITRFYSWFLFTLSCFFILLKLRGVNKKLLITSNPPFLFLMSSICSFDSYFLIYDLYPNVIQYKFGNNVFVKFWKYLNVIFLNKYNRIITITESLKIEVDKYLGPSNKSVVIPVWSQSEAVIIDDNSYQLKYSFLIGKRVFIYTGNFGITHNFKSVFELLQFQKNSKLEDLFFLFVGYGEKKKSILRFVKENGINNVLVLDYLSNDELSYLLSISYFGIVTLDKGMGSFSIPSKTFSYLHQSLPVLCFSEPGTELYNLVADFSVGHNFIGTLDFLKFIERLNFEPDLYLKLRDNAKLLAENNYSLSNVELLYKVVYN